MKGTERRIVFWAICETVRVCVFCFFSSFDFCFVASSIKLFIWTSIIGTCYCCRRCCCCCRCRLLLFLSYSSTCEQNHELQSFCYHHFTSTYSFARLFPLTLSLSAIYCFSPYVGHFLGLACSILSVCKHCNYSMM